MDTSEIFIKMCDCEEIQRQWKALDGDFIESKNKIFIIGSDAFGCRKLLEKMPACRIAIPNETIKVVKSSERYPRELSYKILNITARKLLYPIWLPRQDQIQEMMGEPQNCRYLLKRLNEWAVDHTYGWMLNASMEQLWLAFYMWEKHQKTWDGEKWVKK